MDYELVIESIKTKDGVRETKLRACDDGNIYLSTPDASFKLQYNEFYDVIGEGFINCKTHEDSKLEILFAIVDEDYARIEEFLEYWDGENLKKLKDVKVNSFIRYWKTVFKFIEDNVDVKGLKPTYRTEYIDNTDCGGGIFTYVHIDLSFGLSWDDDFQKTYELTDRLSEVLVNQHLENDDEYLWFSEFMVRFEPTAKNPCDFVPNKPTFTALEEWEEDCVVPIEQFKNSIKLGMGTEGHGFYSDGINKSDIPVSLDRELNEYFKFVVWYDK